MFKRLRVTRYVRDLLITKHFHRKLRVGLATGGCFDKRNASSIFHARRSGGLNTKYLYWFLNKHIVCTKSETLCSSFIIIILHFCASWSVVNGNPLTQLRTHLKQQAQWGKLTEQQIPGITERCRNPPDTNDNDRGWIALNQPRRSRRVEQWTKLFSFTDVNP